MSAPHDADQRVHPPTPRRIADFRKRGEIALSRDLSAVASLAGALLGVLWGAKDGMPALLGFMRGTLAHLGSERQLVWREAGRVLTQTALPAGVGAILGFLVAAALQLGWPPVLRGVHFDFSRFLSANALMQQLSPRQAVVRGATALAKVGFVGLGGWWALHDELRRFAEQPVFEALPLGERLLRIALRLFIFAGGAFLTMAAVEFIRQKRALMAKMRMTVEELKREMREETGDPQVRGKRRQRMKELARRRLQSAVREADVVLVNPTEYAVALRYNSAEDRAPKVVAKGRGIIAEHIRELARAAGVPIVPNPPLCRLIHKMVPEGREIPGDLYRAVAEVLAYVYKLKGNQS